MMKGPAAPLDGGRRLSATEPNESSSGGSGLADFGQTRFFQAEKKRNPEILKTRWRRGWDSNPRATFAAAGFQDRCLQPLGHPSKL
jgi:hypothetical protein